MTDAHANTRLEALCDGVFAIALTLLILEVRLPSPEGIASAAELWRALQQLAPTVFAFVLSFGIILITWVNHRATMKLVNNSSAPFIYANGFLLLTVVSLPFPTGLLGEFLGTDHAAPAVVLYNAGLAALAIGWILVCGAALKGQLTKDAISASTMRDHKRRGYFAFAFYALLAVTALWLPLGMAIVTTVSWVFWLTLGIRMKQT
jgi:uncharacterized membrane protein